jgi:hypothetical protein
MTHIVDRDNSRRNPNITTTFTGNCVLVGFKNPVEIANVELHITDFMSRFTTIDKIVIGFNVYIYTNTIKNILTLKDDFGV